MQKMQLALALGEAEYGRRIVSVLMNHYRERVEIHLYVEEYSWMQQLIQGESDSLELNYDILLLADQSLEQVESMDWRALSEQVPVIYLMDSTCDGEICNRIRELAGEGVITFVEKYQEVSSIMDEILKQIGTEVKAVYNGSEIPEKTRLYGVYSLSDNQYQLPFAVTMCSILGERQRVLLLDLQENSGITQMLEEERTIGLEDMVLFCEEEEVTKAQLIACIGHLGKVDLVYPVENTETLCEISARQYLRLLEMLREKLDYDAIVINFGSRFQGFFETLVKCKNLYLMQGKGGLCQWREYEFQKELQNRGYESFQERIFHIDIPISTVTNSCERVVEQWKWNELGDTIRRMSDTESYGCSM